jgi:WD40 repeat protein
VDFNPNKPCMLVSAGNDRKVKFWDTRELSRPVKVLAGHSHWVSSAKYNPYHDQLVVR